MRKKPVLSRQPEREFEGASETIERNGWRRIERGIDAVRRRISIGGPPALQIIADQGLLLASD